MDGGSLIEHPVYAEVPEQPLTNWLLPQAPGIQSTEGGGNVRHVTGAAGVRRRQAGMRKDSVDVDDVEVPHVVAEPRCQRSGVLERLTPLARKKHSLNALP